MTNMRRGFTMIELIFVIVIIGILAAVAIPKLAANKDEALAKTCEHEISQYLTEVAGAYTASTNFAAWQATNIEDVTNITLGAGNKGITQGAGTVVDKTAVVYNCDGMPVVTMTADLIAGTTNYALTAAVGAGGSPAANKVVADLTTQFGGVGTKVFKF